MQVVESILPVTHDIQRKITIRIPANLSYSSPISFNIATSEGFSSVADYQRFLMTADNSNVFLLKYMDKFLNTINIDTLTL